jgi:hypothetical protein
VNGLAEELSFTNVLTNSKNVGPVTSSVRSP